MCQNAFTPTGLMYYVITLPFITISVRRADVCIALRVTIHEGSRPNNALKFVGCPRRDSRPKCGRQRVPIQKFTERSTARVIIMTKPLSVRLTSMFCESRILQGCVDGYSVLPGPYTASLGNRFREFGMASDTQGIEDTLLSIETSKTDCLMKRCNIIEEWVSQILRRAVRMFFLRHCKHNYSDIYMYDGYIL